MWNPFKRVYTSTGLTVELGELVKNGVNIWDFDYPSYYEGEEKAAFEQKVIDHFYFRQIGQETPGRWLHYFRTRIKEIMPYYIQLYESCDLLEGQDPFESYNLTETYSEKSTTSETSSDTSEVERTGSASVNDTNTGSGTEERNGTVSESRDTTVSEDATGAKDTKFSDTPQGNVNILDNGYLTNITSEGTDQHTDRTEGIIGERSEIDKTTRSQTDTRTGSEESTETGSVTGTGSKDGEGSREYTLTRKGNIGVQPLGKELEAFRESFLNIDMQIINELNDLVILVY